MLGKISQKICFIFPELMDFSVIMFSSMESVPSSDSFMVLFSDVFSGMRSGLKLSLIEDPIIIESKFSLGSDKYELINPAYWHRTIGLNPCVKKLLKGLWNIWQGSAKNTNSAGVKAPKPNARVRERITPFL